jgi:hypothetical protein
MTKVLQIRAIGLAAYLFISSSCFAGENASNPLAAVNNTDGRFQYFDLGDADRTDAWIDGAYMATSKLKLKYELHYWNTNVTGTRESEFDSFHFKPIYFPTSGTWGSWNYKLSVGAEWIVNFDHADKGIGCGKPPPGEFQCIPMVGTGSDQIAPLVGLALVKGDWVIVPLLQHFVEYDGPETNQTAIRVIAIRSLPKAYWAKMDLKIPFDWENDLIPVTSEFQLGKMVNPSFGIYGDLLVGLGSDRPYDWGVGVGVRFNY